jgi:hypothetical protein
MARTRIVTVVLGLVVGCGDDGTSTGSSLSTPTVQPSDPTAVDTSTGPTPTGTDGESSSGTTSVPTTGGTTTGTGGTTTTGEASTTGSTTGGIDLCKVQEEMGQIVPCVDSAPPDAFVPDLQWSWDGPQDMWSSFVVPLVANLTDDNGDGEIDLCDVPDVVVLTGGWGQELPANLYVFDGATGAVHFMIPDVLSNTVGPALGDIDGDGLPEIVAAKIGGIPVAYEHDGTFKWMGEADPGLVRGNFGLADVDQDGDVEIYGGSKLLDHTGATLWTTATPLPAYHAAVAADIDGVAGLEIVLGDTVLRGDGTELFKVASAPGYPQVANLDADPEPEVLLTNVNGLTLYDHDGTVKYQDLRPTGDAAMDINWLRPATVHDLDGDGVAEYATSSRNNYAAYEADGTLLWTSPVSDASGIASGTAFDFLGDGVAEAMYGDEYNLFVYDGKTGAVVLQAKRTSATLAEYPVVVDVDNDGSAEVLIVSNEPYDKTVPRTPTIQVFRDAEERWIQARRIWNQHTYHVSNVREDGTIPQVEPKHWQLLNTFRTNAQIEGGGVCQPPG